MYLKPWTKKQIDHVVSQVDKTTIIIYDEQEEEDKKPSRQKLFSFFGSFYCVTHRLALEKNTSQTM